MFRSTARSLRTWWEDFSDDILGADLPSEIYEEDLRAQVDLEVSYHQAHPHRRALLSHRPRRDGAVEPSAAYCLSPVRSPDRPAVTRAPLRS